LITGSLGGIGFATARALATHGCSVTLNGVAPPEVIEARPTELRNTALIGLTRTVALGQWRWRRREPVSPAMRPARHGVDTRYRLALAPGNAA
jgi:hypothetical protein